MRLPRLRHRLHPDAVVVDVEEGATELGILLEGKQTAAFSSANRLYITTSFPLSKPPQPVDSLTFVPTSVPIFPLRDFLHYIGTVRPKDSVLFHSRNGLAKPQAQQPARVRNLIMISSTCGIGS
jgi:hypothetical protein